VHQRHTCSRSTSQQTLSILCRVLIKTKADEKEGRQVSFTDSLPWVPPWDPILEEKPEWARQAVRALAGVWTILGVMLWSCLRPRPAPLDNDAGSVSPRSMAKKLE
jgi:hypothetical protein